MTNTDTIQFHRHEAEALLSTLRMIRGYIPDPDTLDDYGGDPASEACLAQRAITDIWGCVGRLEKALGKVEADLSDL